MNRVTVANAYAALQSEGLIYGKGGSGTFVAPNAKAQPEHQPAENYPAWQQRLMFQHKACVPALKTF